MDLEFRQEQRQTQKLVMTVMLQQAIQLLPLSRFELQQRVQQEMVENPFLEEVLIGENGGEGQEEEVQTPEAPEGEIMDPDLALLAPFGDTLDLGYYEEDLPARPSPEATLSCETSLSDHLHWQLSLSAAEREERVLGALIIGNISEEGYFQGDLEEIAREGETTTEWAAEVLKLIRSFDPPGGGGLLPSGVSSPTGGVSGGHEPASGRTLERPPGQVGGPEPSEDRPVSWSRGF